MQMGGAMRSLMTFVVACLASSGLAQDVLDGIEGNVEILAVGTNSHGALLYEISGVPVNLEEVLRDAVQRNPALSVAVFLQGGVVKFAYVENDEVVYTSRAFRDFIDNSWRFPQFRLDGLDIIGTGRFLDAEVVAAQSAAGRSAANVPSNGCVSNTTPTGSNMTCYTNGRVTYRSVCSVNPVTHGISCRSDSY